MISERLDKALVALGGSLQTPEGRRQIMAGFLRWTRRLLWSVTLAYAVGLLIVVVALRWVGEGNLTSAFLLFIPSLCWLLPLFPLLGVSLLFSWRLGLLQCLIGLLFAWSFMGWHRGRSAQDLRAAQHMPHTFTVLTFNRGESQGSLRPFKSFCQPDVVVLEDAGGRADAYLHAPGYEEFSQGRDIGQFTVLSKFPIQDASLPSLGGLSNPGYPDTARFVISWEGHAISVYAVHLPTPRDTLMACRRGAFLLGILGFPGSPLAKRKASYEPFWIHQVQLAKALLEEVGRDPNPVILAGDFNAPSTGYVHHLVASRYQDTHEVAGMGFGYSFPGETHNPLALWSPWLRIDYVYCDRHWHPEWCLTERDRPSQHRAVTACLRFLSAP